MRHNINDYFIVNIIFNNRNKKWSVRCGTDTTYLGAIGLMTYYYNKIKSNMKLDDVLLIGNIQAVEEYTEKDERELSLRCIIWSHGI